MSRQKCKFWRWSPKQEIVFIRSLSREKILKYAATIPLRSDWNGLSKKIIQEVVKRIIKKFNQKN